MTQITFARIENICLQWHQPLLGWFLLFFCIDVQMLYNLLLLFIWHISPLLLAFLFLLLSLLCIFLFLLTIYFYNVTVFPCAFFPNPLSFTINKDSFLLLKDLCYYNTSNTNASNKQQKYIYLCFIFNICRFFIVWLLIFHGIFPFEYVFYIYDYWYQGFSKGSKFFISISK